MIVGPPCPSGPTQLSALAIRRAVEVLPTPRTPVSRKAWASRPRSIALPSVFTIASWPISSAKVCGRYLRASTRYGEAAAGAAALRAGRARGPAIRRRHRCRLGGLCEELSLRVSASRAAVRSALAIALLARCANEVEADDPARNRCGCFLPDLTRLATAPSADFRGAHMGEAALPRKFMYPAGCSSLAVHRRKATQAPSSEIRPMPCPTAPCYAALAADQPAAHRSRAHFISPDGRAVSRAPATASPLVHQADRNRDGSLTRRRNAGDAERFFATLDTNHDGEIDPDEIDHYETVIAPEVRSGRRPARALIRQSERQ